MLLLTAVTSKEKDDDHNSSQETGIFITHSPAKICSKNNYNNSFFSDCTRTLFTMCYVSLYFTTTAATTNFDVLKPPPAPYECGSMDLRNNCNDFYRLNNCTVITGFLDITFIPSERACDYSEYHFDNLREITDFLFINQVENLTSIKNLFPNLAVIRGQRLFTNYALIIVKVPDLEKIEFKSLVSISRGHVLIDGNPKLCYTEKINWTRLTLRPGTNNIFINENAQCPEAKCDGCKRDSCWSNDVCQKLENDSVLSLMQDTSECHEQCLGGCYNHTAKGCAVCKSYTDHGTCVEQCPNDKYTSSHFLRCYTREECLNKDQYIHENTCVESCPTGYKQNNATGECDYCGDIEKCRKVCGPTTSDKIIHVTDIMHAEFLRGCQILNATVLVTIREFIDQQELVENLKDVKEITGYLRIRRSPYLTSLNFFQNLETIHGYMLENQEYALIIYDNKNLSQLWDVKPGFQIGNGGMYIHGNIRLCNRHIRQFRENVKHDNSLDSIQKSDQEILCSPAKLNLYVKVLNHRSIKFFWPKDQTLSEVEIIYRPLFDKQQLTETSEIDTEVCNRINWHRELVFPDELHDNSTHYIYIVQNLQPHTRYACLVKTFNGDDDNTQEARSEIKYATTKFDIPTAPKISLKSKTYDTLHIEFSIDKSQTVGSPVVDFYVLEVYDIPDDKAVLDTRDYCEESDMIYRDYDEDYNDCCSRRAQERADQNFISQLKKEFACSLDETAYCKENQDFSDDSASSALLMKRFEAWENNYVITSLGRFHLYVLQIKACNQAGCSSYSMLSTRTSCSPAADKLHDFSACKQDDTNEYRVSFSEPRSPNGYITSYALHFRYDPISDEILTEHAQLECITRLEHERNNYVYVAHFNYTFNQAAVRVQSLGYSTFMDWENITTCRSETSAISSNTWIILFVFVLIGALSIFFWFAYKRDCLPQLRRYRGWRYLRPAIFVNEDHNVLMEGFDVVRFQNIPDEDRPLF